MRFRHAQNLIARQKCTYIADLTELSGNTLRVSAISFPESLFPLTSGRKTRALEATISDMRHRCRLRSETGWAEFGYFLCYFKMVAPRALVFRPLVKGNEDSGNEIGVSATFNHSAVAYSKNTISCLITCQK